MNLISRTHHSYERREYAFMIFRKYTIISPNLKYCGKFDVGHEIDSDTLGCKNERKEVVASDYNYLLETNWYLLKTN